MKLHLQAKNPKIATLNPASVCSSFQAVENIKDNLFLFSKVYFCCEATYLFSVITSLIATTKNALTKNINPPKK